jgi:hypothetical protein
LTREIEPAAASITKDRFETLMRKHVRAIGGDGQVVDEIVVALIAEDPWFSKNEVTLRSALRHCYDVPDTRDPPAPMSNIFRSPLEAPPVRVVKALPLWRRLLKFPKIVWRFYRYLRLRDEPAPLKAAYGFAKTATFYRKQK